MKDTYTTYSSIELAQEQPFIRWVQQGEAAESWAAWLDQHPDQRDKVAEAHRLVEHIDFTGHRPSAAQVERIWEKIEAGTREQKDLQARVVPLWQRPRAWMGAAAAVAAVILGVWVLWQADGPEQYSTAVAEQRIVELPDGSRVVMNAASSLSFNGEGWRTQRSVYLEGEAFFEVTEGERFTVTTPRGDVEVLGTSFNVQARDGLFSVHCFTGKVAVRSQGQEELLLPAQGVRLVDDTLKPLRFEGEEAAAWRTGTHVFESRPLEEVFAELERQFGYKINFPDAVSLRQYTGFFESGNLEKALQAVCWPMNLKYEILEDEKRVVVN